MKQIFADGLRSLRSALPRLGTAGSRSALLHTSNEPEARAERAAGGERGARFDLLPVDPAGGSRGRYSVNHLRGFFILRWMGTVGALLIAFGGLGAGAVPVVGNPYDNVPFGSLMSRMLQTASALVFLGVALLVLAWVLMAPYVGAPLRRAQRQHPAVAPHLLWRTFAGWVIPLILTAPLFTQDIYSYLANGSIVVDGLDPYSAGPVQLLGPENELARSVPFIWANSPSPYGPVALGLAGAVSWLTQDSILLGVIAHRLLSILGVGAAGWALTRLALRCRVKVATALWLGILNPLTVLHLIGGIHNESIMLGLILVGVEFGLRTADRVTDLPTSAGFSSPVGRAIAGYLALSVALISCAGMVKVTGFIALGFVGMTLARTLVRHRGASPLRAIALSAATHLALLIATIAVITVLTGIGLGWITGQGGAATIRSWMSATTSVGVGAGFLGMQLGLGDHTDAILSVTRTLGVLVAGVFMVRMLFATFRGSIHPVGGLGVSTLVLVVFFPVVHPWYILWAVFPLAAWANRLVFRAAVVGYSAIVSFFVLPRGLGLPPMTILLIYLAAAVMFVIVGGIWWVLLRRSQVDLLR
ncbi:polyprenol phosphomannose-dependent alpha 1,6 mannosyltransferase MptB [Corynebacterium sp. LK2536]|uniref:polyprenol phosphomannose-dependent alpha 1,6 mannosyltransferase MptB n=1 Tax=Corynebacterium sp. LK2536 TaxID=3110470 RepID=UPI0034D021BF